MTDAEKIAEFKKVVGNIEYLLKQEITDKSIKNLKAYINRIV